MLKGVKNIWEKKLERIIRKSKLYSSNREPEYN